MITPSPDQIAALQASGAQVVVSFSIPAFTALALLGAAKVGYHPIWVVSNVGSDVTTLTGLLKSFSKGAAGVQLLGGMVTDAYLPLTGDSSALLATFGRSLSPNAPAVSSVSTM